MKKQTFTQQFEQYIKDNPKITAEELRQWLTTMHEETKKIITDENHLTEMEKIIAMLKENADDVVRGSKEQFPHKSSGT